MKKTSWCLLVLLLQIFTCSAQVISYEEAKDIAINFFQAKESKSIPRVDTLITYRIPGQPSKSFNQVKRYAFFIFNRRDDNGYVIISGERHSKPILAYSKTSIFCGLNPGKKILFDQYVKEISDLSNNSSIIAMPKSESFETMEESSPLLSGIDWNQEPAPYNSKCPAGCPAGCGAVAMGQILYYYKYPRFGKGQISYENEFADFQNTEYKYELMSGHPSANNEDVSTLLYHCGVSVKMDYDPNGSSCFIYDIAGRDIKCALSENFDYKDPEYKEKLFFSWSDWEDLIKNEIINKRPIIYRAANSGEGHIFNIDGYNSAGLYHVNWGWGVGCSDEYYALTALTPICDTGANYASGHMMLIGIEPANPDRTSPKILSVDYSYDVNTDFIVTFSEPVNPATLNGNYIYLNASVTGAHTFTQSYDPLTRKLTINPVNDFIHGENIDITFTTGIKDLVGNILDGDNNGTPGPSYILNISVESYNHDFSVESVSLSNPSPIAGENVIVTAIVKNTGNNTEPVNQSIYLYDNNNQIKSYGYLPSLPVSGVYTHNFNWTSTAGPHELKAVVSLAGDENQVNDSRTFSTFVGTAGNLLVDGSANPVKDVTLNPGNQGLYVLQLQNTGSADIVATVTKSGTSSNWINLTDGSPILVRKGETGAYNYYIVAPSGTTPGIYTASILFSYENGAKNALVSFNIKVVAEGKSPDTETLDVNTYTIDGSSSSVKILTHSYGNVNSFDLDNNASTGYPSSLENIATLSAPEYFNLNAASWEIYQLTEKKGSASVRLSVSPGTGYKSYSYWFGPLLIGLFYRRLNIHKKFNLNLS